MLSIIGLLFSIIQLYIIGISGLVEISPLLFLGVLMPFYVGYVRGSISIVCLESALMERLRGWVYLAIGVSSYVGYMLSIRIANSWISLWVTFYLIVFAGIAFLYIIIWKWFVSIFGVGEAVPQQYSFFGTIAAALVLTFVLRMITSMYSDLSKNPQYSPLIVFFLWVTWLATCVFATLEKISRCFVNAPLQFDTTQTEKHRRPNILKRVFIYYTELLNFIFPLTFKTNLKAHWSWLSGIVIGLLGIFFLLLHVSLFSDSYLLVSAALFTYGTICFVKMEKIDFSLIITLDRLKKVKKDVV